MLSALVTLMMSALRTSDDTTVLKDRMRLLFTDPSLEQRDDAGLDSTHDDLVELTMRRERRRFRGVDESALRDRAELAVSISMAVLRHLAQTAVASSKADWARVLSRTLATARSLLRDSR